jgi:hypothetical protein
MLDGELKWEKNNGECKEYKIWKDGKEINKKKWSKMENLDMEMERKIIVNIKYGS